MWGSARKRSIVEKRQIFRVMTTKLSFNFRSAMAHRDPKRANYTIADRAGVGVCCAAARAALSSPLAA
jgi:hypothetical protein